MTSIQQSQTPEQAPDGAGFSNGHLADPGAPSGGPAQPGFGSRLRAAREARGLDLEACASALRLPLRVLRKLELDQYDGTDSKVYLGSYIAKYGRHLGIDEDAIQGEVNRIQQVEPVLVTSGGISHSRFLLERYATAAREPGAEARITILVSHRFSTVRMADFIVVLDGAHLVQSGTHEKLMAQGGRYAELYRIQAAAYK